MSTGSSFASGSTGAAAGRALADKRVVAIARVGILSRAVNYLVLAVLVILVLLGRGNQELDRRGAIEAIAAQPFGRVLLILLCVGVLAYIAWMVVRTLSSRAGESTMARLGRRLVAGVTAIVYAGFLVTIVRFLGGSQTSSPQGRQQTLTASLLASGGGRLLVALAGIAVIGAGIGLLVYAVTRKFEAAIGTGSMGPAMRRLATVLGVAGQAARGLVYVILGGFVLSSALAKDAAQSKGLDTGLHTLAGQPFGAVMLAVVGLGFLAFGLFSLIDARYHNDFTR
ncbi:MAG: DUF1206 domain-containing protein [Candidatus Dormibacteraeota bacterium]|nr:DUF1206 domain-containing protein [Candidatus Dormibacteraeota bacterium]